MFLGILSIIAWWIRSLDEDTVNANTSPLPNVARVYNLYSDDEKVDIYGSSRTYVLSGLHPDWVSLSCKEMTGAFSMVTGDIFKGVIGFNPKTGKGVWSGEIPNKGILQTGKISLLPNSYGGFDAKFMYDNGKPNCRFRLVPVR